MAGTIAAWAEELAAVWVTDCTLLDSVAEGGLGVRPDLFRISGYLSTDGGGMPTAEYQVQLAAEGAADAREGAAAIAAREEEVRALQAEVGSLSSRLAVVQLQGGGQFQCLLSAGRECVPFAATIAAAGQAADAEAAEGAAQAPAAAQELEAGESGGSKPSSKPSSKRSSRGSQASKARSSIRAELTKGGVPSGAVGT